MKPAVRFEDEAGQPRKEAGQQQQQQPPADAFEPPALSGLGGSGSSMGGSGGSGVSGIGSGSGDDLGSEPGSSPMSPTTPVATRLQPSVSSPPLPRVTKPLTKRGVSISGAHTVSMQSGHQPSVSIAGLPIGLSPELVAELTQQSSKAAAAANLVRRAQSLPRIEEDRDKRLLHAVKNQQRWLVNWILAKNDKELQMEGAAGSVTATAAGGGSSTPPQQQQQLGGNGGNSGNGNAAPQPLASQVGRSASANAVGAGPAAASGGGGGVGVGGGTAAERKAGALRRSKSTIDALINEKDVDGRTPLHYAARWGDMEVVQTLIARGADVRAADAHGHTPADEAEYWGHGGVRDHLRSLELGKDTMEKVVEAGDVRGLKELLLRGTHIKGEGYCLLHRAAKKGDLAMLRLLLAAGLEATARDEEGHTPAEVALMSGHLRAFEMLVAKTAGQPAVEEEELGMPTKTPLHAAAECGSVEAVLRYGREWPVDGLDSELNTPLHCAIMHGHADAARALVHDLKADVNKRNRWGTTPLAEAVRLGHDETAAMLRDHGACLFLEIDSQQVVMEPRDQYFLRLELATSLLFWAAVTPRPSLVRFFHATHHNSLLLCCSVRPRLVPDNRSSSSSIRSWGSASEDELGGGGVDEDGMGNKGEEEADAVMSHLVLDDRTWFLAEAFKDNKPLVVPEAAGRDPNDLFLSPLMAYTQNRHLAVIPMVANGRRLGAFLLLFKSEAPPQLPVALVEEMRQVVAGTEKDVTTWLDAPGTDAARMQLLLQSRWLKQRIKEWVGAVYSQESYNFYNPNRQMCALLQAVHAQRRSIALADVCQRCPWVQQLVDAVFYMVDVLLPMPPSKPLFALNAECASELRAMGFRPPDLRAATDSPVYANWVAHIRAWTDQGEQMERDLASLQAAALQASALLAAQGLPDTDGPALGGIGANGGGGSSTATGAGAAPWAFSHRDVFDLIGKHKYDHTLPELLSSLAAPQGGAFPWYERAFAECLATKLSGSGAMRQGAALGVVTHYLYRTFMHRDELAKAWAQLHRAVDHLWAEGRPATAIFVLYKSVLEFLHPFHDGNGRFSRVVASVLLRRAGFTRALIHSENKILSLKEFFDIVTKEVVGRTQRCQQRLLALQAQADAQAAASASAEAATADQQQQQQDAAANEG